VKLVHLVGFITKKFVTVHGHMNVKFILFLLRIILIHPTDLISMCIFIACTDFRSFRIIFVVSVCIKNFEKSQLLISMRSSVYCFMCRVTKRLGSIIQGMKLFSKIILSYSFSQLFGF
jgi:hypothetical protein